MNGPADAAVRRRLALRARSIRPQNWMRAEVESYQAELLTELDVLNRQADELVQRRKDIVEQLELCRAALGGEATKLRRQLPLPGEVSAISDALRTEVGAGRIARVRRGLYAWRESASP